MSVEKERRAAGGQRIPIKTLVEIGAGQDGSAAFEAESVDVTTSGMHLRTAYLPELGEPLICKFEAAGREVMVQGEVAWRNEEACGGDFGVRFLDVDEDALAVLRELAGEKLTSESEDEEPGEEAAAVVQRGARVRLHIEGLGSPMKARVRDASTAEVMVGSNLEFLKVGRPLDLENIDEGDKRGARIERVNIEIDPASKIPQLVVALRYLDAPEDEEDASEEKASSAPATRMASAHQDDDDSDEDLARKAGKPEALWNRVKQMGPVLSAFGGKAKSVMNTAIEKAKGLRSHAEDEAPRAPMRVTSPAPAGGLRSGGRKGVVREEPVEDAPPAVGALKKIPKKAFVAGAAALVLCITIFAIARKPAPPPGSAAAAPDPNAAASAAAAAEPLPAAPGGPMVANVPLFGATPMTTNEPAALPPAQTAAATPPPADDKLAEAAAAAQEGAEDGSGDTTASADDSSGDDGAKSKPEGKPSGSKSFVHGKVKHPVVLSLRMSGPIKSVKGMPTATGFTVHVAGAQSKDAAAGLAHKDPRIASIKVTNKGNGADLTVQFKDGVPAYAVRGSGSNLQIAIGRAGADKAEEKKTAKAGGKNAKKKAKAKK